MQVLPIQAIPNQDFSIVLDENRWDISIRACEESMAITMVRNNETIISNLRAVANIRIIPCQYQESGNFVITTQGGQLPDYTQFGITQSLVYLNQTELDALRDIDPVPIRAAYFNPIVPLPLRFSPQGYVLA